MIDAVLSDAGQVLVHFQNALFFEKMTRFTRRSAAEIRAATHDNLDLLKLFDLGKIGPEEFYRRAVAALEARIGYEEFCEIYNDVFTLNESVVGVLRGLKPEHKLVVLSNTDVLRFSYIMRRFPELHFFDAYVVSFEVGLMKPDPEIFKLALKRAETRPENAVFIDDLPENIAGAERVGIRGILFTPQTDLTVELRRAGIKI